MDAGHRGAGIGRALMRRAEVWAAANGYAEITLHSNVTRAEAHRFYHGIGYQIAKTSYLFSKPVAE